MYTFIFSLVIIYSHLSTPILILFARQFWLLCRALRKSADQKLTWCISTCHPKSKYMCDRFFEEYENVIQRFTCHFLFWSWQTDAKCLRCVKTIFLWVWYRIDPLLWCCRSVGSTVSSSQTFSTHLFWHWSTQEWRTRRCWRLNIN